MESNDDKSAPSESEVNEPTESVEPEPPVETGSSSRPPPTIDDGRQHIGETWTGTIKWYNVSKGFGFIIPDDHDREVFIHQSEIQMEGFRSVGDGERVRFRIKGNKKKGIEAAELTGLDGPLKGHIQRPLPREILKSKIRCFKCGSLGHHLAEKCTRKTERNVCYNCQLPGHIRKDCPHLKRQGSFNYDDDIDNKRDRRD